MSHVVALILGLHGPLVYAVIAALVFLEAAAFIGLVVPGETALLLGGALAAQGGVSVWLLFALTAVGAVLGDSMGYWMGRRFGPRLERSRAGRWVGAERWRRADDLVARRGPGAVALGRWVGILRALVPPAAGMARMPYRRFLLANVLGGVGWVAGVLGLGFGAGGSVAAASSALGTLSAVGLTIAVGFVAVMGIKALQRRRSHTASPDAVG